MSVLTPPRASFHGLVDWDPCTVNNYPAIYDEKTARPKPQPGIGWDHYVDWLTDYTGQAVRAGWNVYGAHGVDFQGVKFVGGVLAQGDSPSDDPLLGREIAIRGESWTSATAGGRLVDVNSYGSHSSQIFFDRIVVGDDEIGVTGQRTCRMYSRWFGTRNLGGGLMIAGPVGVIWQCGLPKDRLEWGSKADSSPTLKALREAVEGDAGCQGLVVRFAAYRTLYYQTASYKGVQLADAKKLADAYKDGFKGGNPAQSVVTGSLGLWGEGELSSAPTERLLVPGRTRGVGPAAARLDRARRSVTLDMLALVPEDAEDDHLHKVDLGDLTLQAVGADGSTTTVGKPLPYDRYDQTAYQASGGIVEVPLGEADPEAVAAGALQVVSSKHGTIARERDPSLLAETDQRGRFVDEGEEAEVTLHVYEKGAPIADGRAKVLVMQYDSDMQRGDIIAERAGGEGAGRPLDKLVLDVAGGKARFKLSARKPGICYLVYTAFPADQWPDMTAAPDWRSQGYTIVRAMPFDNALERNTGDDELSWKFLYDNVLRAWDLVYPIMSVVRDLHDKTVFDGMAEQVRVAISPEQFETCWYMPITRDLSAGKRKLILRYLNLLPNRVPPDDATPRVAEADGSDRTHA